MKITIQVPFSLSGTTANTPPDCKQFLTGSMTIHLAVSGFTVPNSLKYNCSIFTRDWHHKHIKAKFLRTSRFF